MVIVTCGDSSKLGVQLDAMAKGDLAALPKFPTVFARVSPANKLKIVNALQLKGEICAMTGISSLTITIYR